MATIPSIKSNTDAVIRQQTTANSVTTDIVSDQLDALADEIKTRGMLRATTTAGLATLLGSDSNFAAVDNVGIFKFAASGTANGVDTFAASGSGVWILILKHPSTLTKVNLTDAATIQWDFSLGPIAHVTIGANRNLNISNIVGPATGLLKVTQGGSGNFNISLPGSTESGFAFSTLGFDILEFYYDGTTYHWSISNYGTISSVPTLSTPGSFLVGAAGSNQINLSWAAVTNATGYVVQRALDAGFSSGLTTVYTGSGTSFNNTGLSPNTTYYYRVKATASGYNDSPYATGSDTTGILAAEELDYTTKVGITGNAVSGVWTGADTGWGNQYGVASKKLPAGQDGHIQLKYEAIDGESAMIGFRLTNANEPYTSGNYKASAWIFSGTLYYIDNGGGPTSTTGISVGNWFRIVRTGSVLKLQKSTNETSWTDVYTYTFSSTADLYIILDIGAGGNKAYHPKGINITA